MTRKIALKFIVTVFIAAQTATALAADTTMLPIEDQPNEADSLAERPAPENEFTLNFDLLTRGEVRKGGLSSDDNSDDFAAFVVERTLFGMQYDRKGLTSKVTAQHSGTWGSNETNSFNIYEAWANIHSSNGFFAKIGRQNLSYDDQRIFGADNWAMTAISHDALKVGFERANHKIHLIGAFNQNINNMNGGTFFKGGLQTYKAMEAAWYHYDLPLKKHGKDGKKIPTLGISLLFTNLGLQTENPGDSSTIQQQLAGTYVKYDSDRLTAEAATYIQRGKEVNSLPVEAWMFSSKLSYRFYNQLNVYGGYDYLSGDKQFAVPRGGDIGLVHHDKVRGFSSINGSHHKFYGAMDFFYVSTYVSGFTPGLQNVYIGFTGSPIKNITADVSYHYLATATKLEERNQDLGQEIELSLTYSLKKDINISAGYSYMSGTQTMEDLKRTSEDRALRWGWIMLSVSPSVLKFKW